MKQTILICVGLLLFAGCQSPLYEGTIFEPRPYRQELETERMVSQVRQQSDQVGQLLQDQIEALNRSLNRLEGRVMQLERTVAQRQTGYTNEGAALRQNVQQLQDEIKRLRSDQGRLRTEITSDLVSRVEKVVAKQQYAPPVPSRNGSSGAPVPSTEQSSGYEHKVERGQTLTEIARGYGTTIRAIMDANKIKNPSAIRVGQILFIPDPER